ncbi:MAG: hypothetical protein Q8P99_02045 [bacterium]|nr:hypothetical protein [bacterium]
MAHAIITIAAILVGWLLCGAIWHATRANVLLKDPLLGVKWQGYGSLGPNLILYFGGIGEHPGYPIFPTTVRWLKKIVGAKYLALGLAAPGFGKTSDPSEFGIEDGDVPYEIFAKSLVRALELADVRSVRCVGTSLGANLIATFAAVAVKESNLTVEKVALIEGLLEPMTPEELKKRFAGNPMKSARDRLVFKWFSPRKFSIRFANRGVLRMIVRELIPLSRRMDIVRFHQEQLANSILERNLFTLRDKHVPVTAYVVKNSPLSGPVAWKEAHYYSLADVHFSQRETHLSLTNDPVLFGQAIA